jgi:lambda repressor-like predicted transcriptional regulator
VNDPFALLRELTDARQRSDWAWRCEVMALRAAGFSIRAIAEVAGVSRETVRGIR